MNSQHAIIVHSLDGVISDWNAGAEAIFGYARGEAIGKRLNFLIPDDAALEHHETMRQIGRGEEVARPESMRLHKSGQRVEVRLTASPLRDRDGNLVGAVTALHDRADVRRLEQRCQQGQEMEAFAHLAEGMVHDFNNLLTIILGHSEELMSRCEPTEPKRGLAVEIHKAGKRAETLIRQLLVLNARREPEPKWLDLNTVVTDTQKLLVRASGANILVTTLFAPNLHPIKVDPAQIQQVIVNLAIVARDAMPTGGRLTLLTANVIRDLPFTPRAGAAAAVLASPLAGEGLGLRGSAEFVLLSIRAAGAGMSDAVAGHLLQPSCAARQPEVERSPELANVLGIVNSNGGHMEVESESGRRTFKIYFPRAAKPPLLATPRPDARALPQGGETILLVEDEEVLLALTSRVLKMCRYNVLEASNGQDALWIGVNHTGPIDLLVSDIVLPHVGGRELAERLLASHPQLKILFLSGYPLDMAMENGIVPPGSVFLQKPFPTETLARAVRELLDRP